MRVRSVFPTALLGITLLVGCDLAPELKAPKVDIPTAFKHAPTADDAPIADGKWAAANPAMAEQFGQDEWWKIFGDATLNALVDAAYKESPTLKAAKARLKKARAFTRSEESRLWPDVTLGGAVQRQKFSAQNPNFPPGVPVKPFTLYNTDASIDYELDIFGRARNLAKAARAREAGATATYKAAKITLAADVAEAYFRLRGLRAEETVLKRNLALRTETLSITRKRYEIGDVSDLEVATAESEEATTRADLYAVEQQRIMTENALAILTGKPPASFTVTTTPMLGAPPAIPAGLPATLLERRPDVATAAREMAATNAEIGYARGAFFPAITLGASFGYQAADSGSLFDWSSRTWLLGPANGTMLSLPVFTGGRLQAQLATAKLQFREAVANYRAQVLTAFQETEDALAGVRTSKGVVQSQEQAASAAERAYRIARLQYENGVLGYLERIDSERTLLNAQRAQARARADQYVATVSLIRALGGGWDVTIPKPAAPETKATPTTPTPAKDTAFTPTAALPKATAAKPSRPKAAPLVQRKDATIPLTKNKAIQWQPLSDKPLPQAKPKPVTLPFKKRRPNRPVPGLPQ